MAAFCNRTANAFTWLTYGAWGEPVALSAGSRSSGSDRAIASIVANNRVCGRRRLRHYAAAPPWSEYEAQRAEEWRHVLADSGPRVVIAAARNRDRTSGPQAASLARDSCPSRPASTPSSYAASGPARAAPVRRVTPR
jgi:hypothetical protein